MAENLGIDVARPFVLSPVSCTMLIAWSTCSEAYGCGF